MTLAEILAGPTADRPNRAGYPMTEAEARGFLMDIERQMPRSRRGPCIARLAAAPVGNLSQEARDLYRAYAAAYGH